MSARYLQTFLLTFVLLMGSIISLNYVVDPFGMNQRIDLGLPKDHVSRIMNERLFKALAFQHARPTNVVIGDSRSDLLKAEYFSELGAEGWFNLSFGGCSLDESLVAFEHALRHPEVKQVILCAPFNRFDANDHADAFSSALDLAAHPAKYYTCGFVLQASLENLASKALDFSWHSDKPPMERSHWWQYQLTRERERAITRVHPVGSQRKLEETIALARRRGVAVTIMIPPQPPDLRETYRDCAAEDYASYKQYLQGLAPVIDFDVPDSEFSLDANFKDLLHVTDDLARQIVRELVQHSQYVASRSQPRFQ